MTSELRKAADLPAVIESGILQTVSDTSKMLWANFPSFVAETSVSLCLFKLKAIHDVISG